MMDTLSRITFPQIPRIHALSRFPTTFPITITPLVSVLRAGPPSVSHADEDVLQMFFKERELNGDFISRASDILWQRNLSSYIDSDDISKFTNNTSQQTQKMLQDSSARRKKLNILKYESLKREILLLYVAIGLACSGYCLMTLSVKAAVSYAIGVLFSCLYLQLLYQHADNLSSETVPKIFTKKKSKKIGIRSEDLRDFLEKSIKGCSMSLSSPRIVIPAAIFGLWVLSHQYFTNDFFDFQLVPAMFGMFVYKAAVLVQVYRDNEELQFVFPENWDGSSD